MHAEHINNCQTFLFITDILKLFINRREHLSPEDIQKNKAMMESLSKGTWDNCEVSTQHD